MLFWAYVCRQEVARTTGCPGGRSARTSQSAGSPADTGRRWCRGSRSFPRSPGRSRCPLGSHSGRLRDKQTKGIMGNAVYCFLPATNIQQDDWKYDSRKQSKLVADRQKTTLLLLDGQTSLHSILVIKRQQLSVSAEKETEDITRRLKNNVVVNRNRKWLEKLAIKKTKKQTDIFTELNI